jgi:SAM-dependent methyltransferase
MVTYKDALKFAPGTADEKEDIVAEFRAVTGCPADESSRFLDYVLFWDEKIKLNRGREINPPPFGHGMTDRHWGFLHSLCHRLRLPGLNRARRMEEFLEVVRKIDPDGSFKTVLDFGAGIGNDGLFFARNGYQVTCGELPGPNDDWIAKRFELREMKTLSFANILALGDRKFDLLFCMDVLEHIYDVEDALAKMVHWVRKGGLIAIEEDCFNVLYNNDHLEKNRFYHRRVAAYLRGLCVPVSRVQKLQVFRKTADDGLSLNDLKTLLYRRTLRRAAARIAASYVLMPFSLLEMLFWSCASVMAAPMAGLLAKRVKKDRKFVLERLPNFLYQHGSYLLMDRFADAVASYRIAKDRLRKIRGSAAGQPVPGLDRDAPSAGGV